jgi:nucleotide-binding universal stress UspA family protein
VGDTILVGVDGSPTALEAADAAARMARAYGAPLHLVTAFDTEETEVVKIGDDEIVFSTHAVALKVADDVAAKVGTGLQVSTSAEEGKPADVLVREAERLDAACIVVGNRRMQGIGRVLGSIANTVAHHAPCDVHIVKTV